MHVHEGGCWISPGLLQQVIVESKAEAQTSLPMLIQVSYLLLMIETETESACLIFKDIPCYLLSARPMGFLLDKKDVHFVMCLVTLLTEMKGANYINPIKNTSHIILCCLKWG